MPRSNSRNTQLTAGNWLFADYDNVIGYGVLHISNKMYMYVNSTSGFNQIMLAATVPTGQLEVLMAIKDKTLLDMHLLTSWGTGTNGSIFDEALDQASQRLAVGKSNTGNSCRQEFGIFAMWRGAVAETLSDTHRGNLATFLA